MILRRRLEQLRARVEQTETPGAATNGMRRGLTNTQA